MTRISSEEAREQLGDLLRRISQSHEPIHIEGSEGSAVLVSEEDWRSIQETLYLMSVPGLEESIVEGLKAPLDYFSEEPHA